ncbi:putative indole-3-pyruvate monooxygenase [Helianthus annuus]|nr:putative indole-3-pyruvate monooxygenase [Helianthus annuus]
MKQETVVIVGTGSAAIATSACLNLLFVPNIVLEEDCFILNVYVLDSFKGLIIRSSEYENGKKFRDKDVLVVGARYSSMEIAYDLCNWGAQTSIFIRSPLLYGDLGGYGIQRPFKGPFRLKKETGRSPVIVVGTISKIKQETLR